MTNNHLMIVILGSALTLGTLVTAGPAAAIERDIGARAEFVPALSLTQKDVEFGTIEYTENAGANTVTLTALDGALNCSNSTQYNCPSNATPGEISIIGGTGYSVDIFCSNEGMLSNGSDIFDMNGVELGHEGASYGCQGLRQVSLNHTISDTDSQNSVNIGGKIMIPNSGVGAGGVFTTAQTGGAAINVRVVYQ